MQNHDAGHNHFKTAYFVADCPLCDAEKAARNRGIAHLSEALGMLEHIRPEGVQPTIRVNLGPVDLTNGGTDHCYSVDLTAKQAEALADAIDSMNAYLGSEAKDRSLINQMNAVVDGALAGLDREALGSGEYSAAAIAEKDGELVAEITEMFDEISPESYLEDVFGAESPEAAMAAYEQLVTGEWDGEL